MGKIRPFRFWYYLRIGYQMYFAFIFTGINMLTVTYYLAIERAPFLEGIFPTFLVYALILIVVGLPILVLAGWLHFKRIPAFKSEQEVAVESNPYIYKLNPGMQKHVIMPYNMLTLKILLKISNNEKILDEEIKEIEELQKKIKILLDGGYVGIDENSKLPFKIRKKK